MAKSTKFGYADSAVQTVDIATIPYSTDTAIQTEESGKLVLVNTSAPLDQPELLTTAITSVKDVYSNTSIDASVRAASKQGFSLVAKAEEVLRVTDDTDASFQVDLPVSAHIVIKAPNSQYVTEEQLLAVVGRAFGLLYDGESSRIDKLVRGALSPSSL